MNSVDAARAQNVKTWIRIQNKCIKLRKNSSSAAHKTREEGSRAWANILRYICWPLHLSLQFNKVVEHSLGVLFFLSLPVKWKGDRLFSEFRTEVILFTSIIMFIFRSVSHSWFLFCTHADRCMNAVIHEQCNTKNIWLAHVHWCQEQSVLFLFWLAFFVFSSYLVNKSILFFSSSFYFFFVFFCYSSLFSLHFASTRPKCAINMKRGIYFLIVQEKIFVVVVAKMEYPKWIRLDTSCVL